MLIHSVWWEYHVDRGVWRSNGQGCLASENAKETDVVLHFILWQIFRMVKDGNFHRYPVSNPYDPGMTRLTSGPPARLTTTSGTTQQVTTLRLFRQILKRLAVVWSTTRWRIGPVVSMSLTKTNCQGRGYETLLVCNYAKGGNMKGERFITEF